MNRLFSEVRKSDEELEAKTYQKNHAVKKLVKNSVKNSIQNLKTTSVKPRN